MKKVLKTGGHKIDVDSIRIHIAGD